jgi:hypothetical protein
VGDLRLGRAGKKFGGKGSGGGGQRFLARRNGFGRIRKVDGVTLHGFPGFVFVLEAVFVFELVEGLKQELGDKGEIRGDTRRDAVLGDGLEELAEDEIDVGGGHEAAGERSGELRAETIGFEKLALGASVKNAERRMVRLAQHAAEAAVGERELAEAGFIAGDAGTRGLWFRHERLLVGSKEVDSRQLAVGSRKTERTPRAVRSWHGEAGFEMVGGGVVSVAMIGLCGREFLEVWQGKDLTADFADVWQIKELATGDACRVTGGKTGEMEMEKGKWKSARGTGKKNLTQRRRVRRDAECAEIPQENTTSAGEADKRKMVGASNERSFGSRSSLPSTALRASRMTILAG